MSGCPKKLLITVLLPADKALVLLLAPAQNLHLPARSREQMADSVQMTRLYLSIVVQCRRLSPILLAGDLPVLLINLCGELICSQLTFTVMVTNSNMLLT